MKRHVFFCLLLITNPLWGRSPTGKDSLRLIPINEQEVSKLLISLRGKVVLVNLWATWCAPCVEEFPHLVRIQKLYSRKGVRVIFISVDDQEVTRTSVRPFLEKQNVTFPTYFKNSTDDEEFINALGKDYSGALPTTFVYDRQGRGVATFVGAKDFDTFERVIRPLL